MVWTKLIRRLCIHSLSFYVGDSDPMVQLRWARMTADGVKAMGFKQYSFQEYKNMGHSSCDQVTQCARKIQISHSNVHSFLGNDWCHVVYYEIFTENRLTNTIGTLTLIIRIWLFLIYTSVLCYVCVFFRLVISFTWKINIITWEHMRTIYETVLASDRRNPITEPPKSTWFKQSNQLHQKRVSCCTS